MKVYTVTIKRGGQIMIPADIRQALELKAGDKLEVYEVDEESFYVAKPEERQTFPEEKTEPTEEGEVGATSL